MQSVLLALLTFADHLVIFADSQSSGGKHPIVVELNALIIAFKIEIRHVACYSKVHLNFGSFLKRTHLIVFMPVDLIV